MEKKLIELLDKVFSPEGTLLSEDRDEYKELIQLSTELYPHLNLNFGNPESGEINAKNLLKIRDKLNNLKSLYEQVYTFDGEVRACGRQTCIKLIESAAELYPGVHFGNTQSGQMNFWKLLEYRDTIFVEYKDS